ncbi:Transcription factor, fungi [Penicillium italicum]|uniref:Transcription factor, fungi n=1 Tax=Penicillium italicum TaxID=40296 RepID=A0A0A2LF69_PENIT|nr:Transcription factor, fungi [Penicillium italicum]
MEFMPGESGAAAESTSTGESNFIPRPKRIACVVCRRRKLRCDGRRPSCGTCSRLGHECSYDEVRKKSGPKRGYVKQLEARLAQVETLLKCQDPEPTQRTSPQPLENAFTAPIADESILDLPDLSDLGGLGGIGGNMDSSFSPSTGPSAGQPSQMLYPPPPTTQAGSNSHWDLISLGLEEPLPSQDVIDELDALFFEKIYPMMPIIHRPRYYAALNLAPNMRPPICLRYIMWCNAASISDKYFFLHNHFYQRARKYAEVDEMKGFGENIVSLAHCQTWIFIGTYEFRMIYFPRAWLSVGKAARLALMLGLNRLDGVGLDVKQSILPPKDWTEREERRRVFWGAFATDRYSSVGTGWPILIDENDIMTNLPASEESFTKSKPQRTLHLNDIITGDGISTLAPFACVMVLASLFGRNLVHIHRPQPQDNDHDLNGEFWKRHRSHDNILLHISLSLPDHLRLPSGLSDVNVIFANMSIHTSTICLHQAAIFKAEKNKMPNQITTESKRRCLVAANQISSTMKMISHVDLTSLNPFTSFCLYIAARVFVQYLKSRPEDSSVHSSLQFLVSALNAMKNKNPLTESFLVQLDVDLDGTGIRALDDRQKASMSAAHSMQTHCHDNVDCAPIYGIRQTQGIAKEVSAQYSTNRSGNQHPMPAGLTTSLPNRSRDSTTQPTAGPAFNGDDTRRFFGTSAQATGSQMDQARQPGATVDVDMEFSTNFGNLSDRNNPPSDHPTPSTLNSSSNTSNSINGTDAPSPGNKNQKTDQVYPSQVSGPSFDKVNPNILPQANTNPQVIDLGSIAGRFYPNNSDIPSVGAGASGIFSMPSAWDLPTPNPETGNEDFGGLNMETFSESQWVQMLNTQIQSEHGTNAGWENWRQS